MRSSLSSWFPGLVADSSPEGRLTGRGGRVGLTLVELLVALGVIGLLLALLLPAVQQVRSAARRTECVSHLKQFGLAIHNYHDIHQMFPAGNVNSASVFTQILPQLDQAALFNRVVFEEDVGMEANAEIRRVRLPILLCPADPVSITSGETGKNAPCNYGGNWGVGVQFDGTYNGFFRTLQPAGDRVGGPLRASDMTDGLSQTAAFSEALIGGGSSEPIRRFWDVSPGLFTREEMDAFVDACSIIDVTAQPGFAWWKGRTWTRGDLGVTLYNHLQTPNHLTCTNQGFIPGGTFPASSLHAGGVNLCLGDGAVRFVSDSIDRNLWRSLGTRSSGDPTTDYW